MSDPCELFEQLAEATWDRLDAGSRFQVLQGETAITDHLLLELARREHPSIQILKTPHFEEQKKGTDWEWWIGNSRAGWLRYAVQAKRLDLPTGGYPTLGHKVTGTRQIEILERFAQSNEAIPLYCFYNHLEIRDYSPYWHCHRPQNHRQLGCSVAPLEVVRDALNNRGARRFDWIHKNRSLPWRCLVSCPAFLSLLFPAAESHCHATNWVHDFFGVKPKLHPKLPFSTSTVLPQAHGEWDASIYDLGLGLYPKRIAVVTVESGPTTIVEGRPDELGSQPRPAPTLVWSGCNPAS